MALLRRRYAKLHLVVNESQSAVAVFGRKFLGDGQLITARQSPCPRPTN